jgi:hypothetical protein
MASDTRKNVSEKYCPRFGQIAVELGLITTEQLKQALCCQVDDEMAGRAHRLLGEILFDQDLLATEQIDTVLNRLFQEIRKENEAKARDGVQA